ncbi:hypothetical protein C3729_04535 [Cloacibacterium normanense]|uniref:Uncharacterized protein n=1 Tax=Cloacibacterium normanense TaxID=237258 RepID=A0A2S7I6P9_9FLAO|nr:hypothetical protein [Cloacibacterium normanense]PPZ92246.1 hypothetical protein C3729_04535 [Cloacibacterium normanense]
MNPLSRNLINIPSQFHRYLNQKHEFRLIDCYPTVEIEGDLISWKRIPKFYQDKSHRLSEEVSYKFSKSLFIKYSNKNNGIAENLLVAENKYPKLFLAGQLFGEVKHTGTRFLKYMTLFKSYETLTKSNVRDIKFSSTRHSISHTVTQLTQPNVVKTLYDLYDSLEIDLSKFKHQKSFYITFWDMLIETENLLLDYIYEIDNEAEYLYPDLKQIK